MKKLILLLLLIASGFAVNAQQTVLTKSDTVTFERDTIVKIRVTANWDYKLTIVVDSTAGTKDGVVSIRTAPEDTDSLFLLDHVNFTDVMSTDTVFAYESDNTSLGYLGIKIVKNNLTKYYITWFLEFWRDE